MVHNPRNQVLANGVERYSRSAMYSKRASYKRRKVVAVKAQAAPVTTKTVKVDGPKNGMTRVVSLTKASKFYPAEDVKTMKKARKTCHPTNFRESLQPGTVLVLLAGRFRGKRVVLLKTLEKSGLLVVTGPHKINGVPLRRVNPAYVLATSTRVDISSVKINEKVFSDEFFKKADKKKSSKPTEEELFTEKKVEKKTVDPSRVTEQKSIDSQLIAAIKKVPHLKSYLNASFSLKNGQAPHLMKF